MNTDLLFEHFDTLVTVPDGVARLRELILQLAVQGKLGTQDEKDEPADMLLERIIKEKERLVRENKSKKEKPLIFDEPEELLGTIPSTWVWTRLSQVGLVNPRNSNIADDKDVSFIPMTLIPEGFMKSVQYDIRKWGEIKAGFTHFADNDVVIAKITPCFQNRKSVVLKNLKNGIGAGTTELHVFRPIKNLVNSEYVLLFLKTPEFLETGITRMTGSAGQKRVPKNYFSETRFPLPPIAEQHRIVEKVDRLMSLCDELEAKQQQERAGCLKLGTASLAGLQNAESPEEFERLWTQVCDAFDLILDCPENVDVLRQTILQLAVQGRLVMQDPDDEPAEKLVERIIFKKGKTIQNDETPPYNLPKGWIWVKIQAISNLSSGKSFKKSEYSDKGVRLLQITNVKYGKIIWEDLIFLPESYLEDYPELSLNENDILMALNRPLSKGRLKSAKLRSNDVPSILYQRVGRFDLAFDEIRDYFFQYLHSPVFINWIESSMQGSDQPFVNKSHILKAWIPLPPLAEQHRIIEKVNALMALCNQLEARLTKRAAVQELFSGAVVESAIS